MVTTVADIERKDRIRAYHRYHNVPATGRRPTPMSPEQSRVAERYVPFALSIAGRWIRRRPDLRDEIISASLFGLATCAARFDPGTGVSFDRFARANIEGMVIDALAPDRGDITMLAGRPIRRNALHPALEATPSPERGLVDADAAEAILRKLPARHREVLRLIAFEGMTQKEAADHLGCSQTWVSHLVRQSAKLLGGPHARPEAEGRPVGRGGPPFRRRHPDSPLQRRAPGGH